MRLEGHGVSAETQYNYVTDELGLPGLLLWTALSSERDRLAVTRLRRVGDLELRIDLAAMFAPFVALT